MGNERKFLNTMQKLKILQEIQRNWDEKYSTLGLRQIANKVGSTLGITRISESTIGSLLQQLREEYKDDKYQTTGKTAFQKIARKLADLEERIAFIELRLEERGK